MSASAAIRADWSGFDPMIAKLIVHDVDRERAAARMLRALAEFRIEGPPTLLGFHRALIEHPCFVAGTTCAGVVESAELAARAEELGPELSHRTTSVPGRSDGAIPTERKFELGKVTDAEYLRAAQSSAPGK